MTRQPTDLGALYQRTAPDKVAASRSLGRELAETLISSTIAAWGPAQARANVNPILVVDAAREHLNDYLRDVGRHPSARTQPKPRPRSE
jgi:hypothetical protein